MRFPASWSPLLIGITSFTTVLLAVVVILIYKTEAVSEIARVLLLIFFVMMWVVALLLTVRGYRLESGSLYIERLLWKTRIDLRHLRSALADPMAMSWSIRALGNGGFFSVSGLFYSKKLRWYRAWVTNVKDCVVLRLEDRTVVVSPHDPQKFIDNLPGAGSMSKANDPD